VVAGGADTDVGDSLSPHAIDATISEATRAGFIDG
jgi:hypothetical protein